MSKSPSFQQFSEALGATYASLAPQQQQIAQFVLEHPDDVALGTAATVAEAAGVQPSALVRFANSMQLSGFSELQRVCRDRLLQQAGTYRERIGAMAPKAAVGTGSGLVASLVERGVADVQRIAQQVTDAALERAATLLCAAPRIHLLAHRRAFPVAVYLSYALAQLELRVQLHDGIGGMLGETLRQIDADDVLLVTSFKDYTADVIAAAAAARARGIKVIAITDLPLSPLKPASDVCLEIGADSPASVRSLVAPMLLAQALVVSTGQQLVAPAKKTRRTRGSRA